MIEYKQVVIKMLQLPMLAFLMTGMDGSIQLTIEEVFGYPNKTSYGGGYGANGKLTIQSGGFSANATHYFTTGELYSFYQQIQDCYNQLMGIAILENTERELELQCEFNKFGHVIVMGSFQANPHEKNILHFEIKSDQTQMKDTLSQLKSIYEVFGDNKGISR